MTTVLVVDDQSLQRLSLGLILTQHPDMTVVGEASDGAEAVRKAAELHPDIVLMDARMPGMDGIEATRRIIRSGGPSKVVVLATLDLDEYAYDAFHAGASGFLLKHLQPEELVASIRAVATGDAVVSALMPRKLAGPAAHRLTTQPPSQPPAQHLQLNHLTEREREVLVAIARGLNNAEIAARLCVAETTVKSHVSHVLAKIGARDRVQAVIFAYETRLVRPA